MLSLAPKGSKAEVGLRTLVQVHAAAFASRLGAFGKSLEPGLGVGEVGHVRALGAHYWHLALLFSFWHARHLDCTVLQVRVRHAEPTFADHAAW